MTATVTFLQKTFNRAVVKVTATAGGDSATITSADLLVLGQSGWSGYSGASGFSGYSALPVSSKMNIAAVQWSCDVTGSISITRDSQVVYKLFGSGVMTHATTEKSANSIVVAFNADTDGGTVILELGKFDGFSPINPAGVQ